MNKYEQRIDRERKSAMRVSVLMGAIGLGFAVLALAGLGLVFAAPQKFWRTAIIVLAVVLLLLRHVMRRLNVRARVAQPDPESTLRLD